MDRTLIRNASVGWIADPVQTIRHFEQSYFNCCRRRPLSTIGVNALLLILLARLSHQLVATGREIIPFWLPIGFGLTLGRRLGWSGYLAIVAGMFFSGPKEFIPFENPLVGLWFGTVVAVQVWTINAVSKQKGTSALLFMFHILWITMISAWLALTVSNAIVIRHDVPFDVNWRTWVLGDILGLLSFWPWIWPTTQVNHIRMNADVFGAAREVLIAEVPRHFRPVLDENEIELVIDGTLMSTTLKMPIETTLSAEMVCRAVRKRVNGKLYELWLKRRGKG